MIIDTAFNGLGDRLVALVATRILARNLPQYKFLFASGLKDVITSYGPDHLVEPYDPNQGEPANCESIRISMNPDRLHRRKWGSDSINYLGSYLMNAVGPQVVSGRPRLELPAVPRHEGLDFDYIVIQPRAGFAKPDMSAQSLQAIVDSSPLPVVCAGSVGTEQDLRHVNYDYLGDELCTLKLIRHASLVLTPRSSSTHIAAAYNVPCICWVPNDGENWHLDYQDTWSRTLLPIEEATTEKATIAWMRNNIPVPKNTVLCINRFMSENVGDRYASPSNYFNLGSTSFARLLSPRAMQPVAGQVVVIGGGGLQWFPEFREIVKTHEKCVIWGAGGNQHYEKGDVLPEYGTFPFRTAGLCGIRDFGLIDYRWVPDPSCMSPLFDIYSRADPQHEVVVYSHMDRLIPIDGVPWRTNRGHSMEDAIRFLASGDVVVTNSYHGVYWATLLGRRVVCYEPFSTRFWHFKHPPVMCDTNNWRARIKWSSRWESSLEECRRANRDFYVDVLKFINS